MIATTVIKNLKKDCQKRFDAAAKTIPSDVVEKIRERAVEAVKSGESHKISGGWVILPFKGQYEILGLLQVATNELKAAQIISWGN